MILSFNTQFPAKILEGKKIHTIREDKHSRWKKGTLIHMVVKSRTPDQQQFTTCQCTGVQDIEIKYTDNRGAVEIHIDGRHLGTWHRFMPMKSVSPEKIIQLAVNDGFEGVKEFLNWFQRDFKGKIIHWTGVRY